MLDDERSVFQSDLPLDAKLERARNELLDLSARNRLLNVPRFSKTAKTIDVVDERSTEVFRLLVRESRAFTFVAGRPDRRKGDAEDDGEEEPLLVELAQPDEDDLNERGVAKRHADTALQTRMTPSGLQKRLLELYYDSRTLEEEQGVNILFLAMGTLKWIDPNNKENIRHAPLVLVPVRLERGSAGERFRLKARPEDLTANLSLEAYLDRVHALSLPPFEAGDEFDPAAYFEAVAGAIATKEGWEVSPDDIVLGFFSFAKFLMYRDLDPATWPIDGRITDQPTIRALLADGFGTREPLLSEDAAIDRHIAPQDMLHIVDSDSSQTLAVHEVRRGRSLVVLGPPGTGKSQTIANFIAAAIADGLTVLFVAEKMAALEVVKRRLDAAGVGDACLELHSNKANKRMLLDELRRTWELGSPRGEFPSALAAQLTEARDNLNAHADRMHAVHQPSGLTPYQVIGQMVRLRREGQRPVDFDLDAAATWGLEGFEARLKLLAEVVARIDEIGLPRDHPWRGVGLDVVLPTTVERLLPRLGGLLTRTEALSAGLSELAATLDIDPPVDLKTTAALEAHARILEQAPDLSPEALSSSAWEGTSAVKTLVEQGTGFEKAFVALAPAITREALDTALGNLGEALESLPAEFPADAFTLARDLATLLPRLAAEAGRLRTEMGLQEGAESLASAARLVATAERVADAPDASPEAFAAAVWDQGVEQVGDLVQAVADLEAARARLGDSVLDVAWSTDVAGARQALAMHTGILKSLNGDWRRANALMRTVLRDPSRPATEVVALLDVLTAGQSAANRVREGDALGRAAFGPAWRGDRSASGPLLALVAWMRTLRGVGAEARLVAGQLADRSDVGTQAAQLAVALDVARAQALSLWASLGPAAASWLGHEASVDKVPLDRLAAIAENLAAADDLAREVLVGAPASAGDAAKLIRGIEDLQARVHAIDAQDDLGRLAFGSAWQGRWSAWTELTQATGWLEAHGTLRALAARLPDRRSLATLATRLAAEAHAVMDEALQVLAFLKAEPTILGASTATEVPLASLSDRLRGWLDASEQLSKWVAYKERADQARSRGLGPVVDRLEDGRLACSAGRPAFEIASYEAILAAMAAVDPAISRFDGALHTRRVHDFANLDRERFKASSLEVVRAHHKRIPPRDGNLGPLSVLRGEMARKRGHMPIRSLIQKAGPAIQAIKPVMMMSPLSVAQFLTPGRLSFDLLVMDEASQIQPVDALGAIARARQVVVVGDERQLPPTRFFAKMTGSQEDDDTGEGAQVTDIESILGLFVARGLPQRMLRWHYRSRHQSLIAVSNRQFYENKLFIVPSPFTQEAGMGLRFTYVEGGVFDSGNSGSNVVEARAVAQAVMAHARNQPELSLGVATFSASQRRAIQDEVELLRRSAPETEEFFQSHPSEPFFIKNLENVQGDERDVIMISVGYARNAQGYMAMRFGPLGAEGGERRLNVLISRAKRQCEVFASITDEDIDLERAKGKGVIAFKIFLHYARTGRLSVAQVSGRSMESVFEEQVAAALQDRGYQVHPQVGIAGFFIDLAIADPERPGRYLLGIECDGASYHSSRSARDRDRLRQAVLEDHGWIIHRIWSTDWFQRPQESLESVVAAIEAAKAELDARMEASLSRRRAVSVEVTTVDRGDVVEVGLSSVVPEDRPDHRYFEATLSRPGPYELHETPVGIMAALVEQVVTVESPIHVDEVVVRVRGAWGLKRAGGRIQDAVMAGVDAAVAAQRVDRDGDFLSLSGSRLVLRDRSDALSSGLRKPEMISPAEIAAGIRNVVVSNLGATEEEAVQAVSRGMGFKATSAQLRSVVLSVISTLLTDGAIVRQGNLLVSGQLDEPRLTSGDSP